jgi:hypothetical protein
VFHVICDFIKCNLILIPSTNLHKIQLTTSTLMQNVCCPIKRWGRRRAEYCVERVEGLQREKREFGAVTHSLLPICCYLRNQRLGATNDR